MKFHKNKMLATFTAVALVLAVGACSSSGDKTATSPDVVGDPTVAELFAAAQDSKDAAAAAAKAATDAVDAAPEKKFDTLSVKGESMTASANAQAVLDAQTAAAKAVTDAETALQKAKDALEEATEHAADNASLKAALDAAIEAAEKDVKTATDARDSAELKTAVALVEGADEDKPKSADDIGEAVAMDVGGALMPNDTDGGRAARAPHGMVAPTADTDPGKTAVKMSDQLGHTWAQIVGEDNVSPKPIGADRATVMVASIVGMTAATVFSTTVPDDIVDGGDFSNTDNGTNYNGIPGTAYCLGTDCKVTDGKLAGSWYFTPDDATAYYRLGTDKTYTTPETAYAEFGYWLTTVPSGDDVGAIMVNTYARTDHTGTPDWTTTTLTDTSATYSGDAVGMSVHKTTDGDGEITSIYSGEFTADVTLKAEFGAAQFLGGTVDNFRGKAVDPLWTVVFARTPVDADGDVEAGKTIASGPDGRWTADSYGDADARPTGIFGGFNAHFSDGHAAGVYATRK